MNNQEIFDKVVTHLRKQNAKSVGDHQECLYRSPDGGMCAVGCLIPDSEYNEDIEGVGIHSFQNVFKSLHERLLESVLGSSGISKRSYKLLSELQDVHDDYSVEDWERELTLVAKNFKLKLLPKEV
jgi:hypothetical protein